MKKILLVLIFSIFFTNLNATESVKLISNSPNISEEEVLQKIDISKVKKYKRVNMYNRINISNRGKRCNRGKGLIV